jgi:hypothetical protein
MGIVFGWYQMRSARKAQDEAIKFRERLLKQQVSQQFSNFAPKAVELVRNARAKDWAGCAETGLLLSADLASSSGIPEALMSTKNRKLVADATETMTEFMRRLPSNDQAPEAEMTNELTSLSQFILVSVHAIASGIRLETELGGDEHAK